MRWSNAGGRETNVGIQDPQIEEDPEVEKIEAACLNWQSYKCLTLHTAAFKVARKIK